MTNTRLWVLGAADPEMAAIEQLLREAGERVAYATVGGVRAHPGNAYKADGLAWPDGEEGAANAGGAAILVECGGDGLSLAWADEVARIDHHRPGDPGYGRPPEDFLAASSIGQVIAELALLAAGKGADYDGPLNDWEAVSTPAAGSLESRRYGQILLCGDEWRVRDRSVRYNEDYLLTVPDDLVLAAAADHCLEAAYRGRCPGVAPDALMGWRVESRAAFQGRPVADVLADVESARAVLREAVAGVRVDPDTGEDCSGLAVPSLADLRGRSIPELPEAAAREGIPFLATVRDRDGREKVVLQAAPADLVRGFLAGEIVPGLVDVYGDPARGFAGGYVAR